MGRNTAHNIAILNVLLRTVKREVCFNMIIYKELSSLVTDLGISAKALYSASNGIASHYRRVQIPKNGGGYRELAVPDKFLKSIQRRIAERLLVYEEISPYAAAYRYGGSTIVNAKPHLKRPTVLKLDISGFFDHITYPMVKERVFTAEKYSESNRILLTILCIYRDSLPQGAATSPIISNIIMRDFDNAVGTWCNVRGITYTRYSDDMTFSGEFDPSAVTDFVRSELQKHGFYLNTKKTVVAANGQRKVITGIVVNDKVNTPVEYRRRIRQEIYFCKKFGISSHLRYVNSTVTEKEYLASLLGRVNYCLSVDRGNKELAEYKEWILDKLNDY